MLSCLREPVFRFSINRGPMKSKFAHRELSREQLYELIWANPAVKLAAKLGISDVALAKHCKKLKVPRPPRGYWAKVAAGRKLKKPGLPQLPSLSTFMAEPSSEAQSQLSFQLPQNSRRLHPQARELLLALKNATPDSERRYQVSGQSFPSVIVSKPLIEKAARALHVIIVAAETQGVPFRRARSKYDIAYFEKDHSRLHITIEEEIVSIKQAAVPPDKRRPPWEWQTRQPEPKAPSGKLTFSIQKDHYNHNRRLDQSWTEGSDAPLEETLRQAAEGICQHYRDLERKRIEDAEQRRKDNEEYEKKRLVEQKREHEGKLKKIAQTRAADLVKASEWRRLQQTTAAFVAECEQRWLDQSGGLDPAQQAWLAWAKGQILNMCPFESNYPDPARDGAFDPSSIPIGGPYPATRNFPDPPSVSRILPQNTENRENQTTHVAATQQYPFWLKYQGR